MGFKWLMNVWAEPMRNLKMTTENTEPTEAAKPSGEAPNERLVIRDDWGKFIAINLETANRFGGKALVMSEMAVRHVVLETLKAHGLK
jgi:hypothetical protein